VATDLYWQATGSGPAVVLLHSGLTDSRGWGSTLPALEDRFRVIVYDARGYGLSPDPTEPWSPVDDLQAVMDAAGVERAHLVGNSLGAGVARLTAAGRPRLVSSLTLVGSGLPGLKPPSNQPEAAERFQQEMDAGKRFGEALGRGDSKGALEEARFLWLQGPEQDAIAAEVVSRPRRIQPLLPEEGLAPEEVAVPTLVVVGDEDAGVMGLAARELTRRIPGARLEIIPGARHHPQMDQPATFNRVLLDFLASVDF
jgi:pimeloyl-ACP methyl ester carboxylesterase